MWIIICPYWWFWWHLLFFTKNMKDRGYQIYMISRLTSEINLFGHTLKARGRRLNQHIWICQSEYDKMLKLNFTTLCFLHLISYDRLNQKMTVLVKYGMHSYYNFRCHSWEILKSQLGRSSRILFCESVGMILSQVCHMNMLFTKLNICLVHRI